MGTWLEQLKACGVESVAHALGLSVTRGHGRHAALAPCPICRAATRGTKDLSGPIGITGDSGGWSCFRCGARGDSVSLAAAITTGRVNAGGQWEVVRMQCIASGLCTPAAGIAVVSPHVRPTLQRAAPPIPAPPHYPPVDEVTDLWQRCIPVVDDTEVSAWLKEVRGIDPIVVFDLDLARALPCTANVPHWAWAPKGREVHGGSWSTLGYRLIVPLYNAKGQMCSLRARRAFNSGQEKLDGRPKSITPAGYELKGLVMAEGLGRLMLSGEPLGDDSSAAEWVKHCGLWISEGEPDFLTLCTQFSDAAQDAPAVLGIMAGSLTRELIARIPDDTTVYIATDSDTAGDTYARQIQAALAKSQVKVRRWSPTPRTNA